MSAKEMFEKLGYKYSKCTAAIYYTKTFEYAEQNIMFVLKDKEVQFDSNKTITYSLSVKELPAINKQVEELGWGDK